MSYTALVVTLESNYQNFHAPEALGLYKALSKFTTIAAIYLLDYILTLLAKLSKSLQTKQLDLSMISSLIGAVLHAMDDAITTAAYWVLELLDSKDDLQQAIGEILSADKIYTFQETVGTPFVALLKENISNRFATHDMCQHGPYLILVTFPILIHPNFLLMERSQLRFCSTTT